LRNAKANARMPHANTVAEQIFFTPPETENFHPIAMTCKWVAGL
jgi:hypothetical protein